MHLLGKNCEGSDFIKNEKLKINFNVRKFWNAISGKAGYVEHHHDGKKDTIIDEPYFSYDSPKTFEQVLNEFSSI